MNNRHSLPPGFWRSFSAEGMGCESVALGPLRLWLRRDGPDWLCFSKVEASCPDDFVATALPETPPADAAWRRLGPVDRLPRLLLRPVMPDRPVVVRPHFPHTILPGERLQFYIGVPLWLRLRTPEGLTLWENPVTTLSNTWFGTPLEGELAYVLRTRARRESDQLDFSPWRVICPVRLRNLTKELLPFDRLCMRVQHLSIYDDPAKGVWGNESGVTVRQDDKNLSRISYARGAPGELQNPELLADARMESKGGFTKRALALAGGLFE